jgi:hypothetical protein
MKSRFPGSFFLYIFIMIEIGHTITSLDVVCEKFECDLETCKGACCVEGDGGAPLEPGEIDRLTLSLPSILPYLAPNGKTTIAEKGFHYTDPDGDEVTMLIDNRECVFTIFHNNIAMCGIEKAYNDGASSIKKPISCYLYPIRLTRYPTFEAVNYHRWSICKCARTLGKKHNTRVFEFLKAPLIEKYGTEWYAVLEQIVAENKGF